MNILRMSWLLILQASLFSEMVFSIFNEVSFQNLMPLIAAVSTRHASCSSAKLATQLEPHIKVVDLYPDVRVHLTDFLVTHRQAVALSDEHLSVTDCVQHHIDLKSGTPIISYHFPHSQRHIADDLVTDIIIGRYHPGITFSFELTFISSSQD